MKPLNSNNRTKPLTPQSSITVLKTKPNKITKQDNNNFKLGLFVLHIAAGIEIVADIKKI